MIVPANGQAPIEVLEGAVEAVSPTTVTVAGRRGTISRHRPLDVPPVGTRVRLELDARGFIRSLVVLDGPANVHRGERLASPDMGETHVRLEVLTAAAAFGARRPDVKSADVLRIADSWLAWLQPEEVQS